MMMKNIGITNIFFDRQALASFNDYPLNLRNAIRGHETTKALACSALAEIVNIHADSRDFNIILHNLKISLLSDGGFIRLASRNALKTMALQLDHVERTKLMRYILVNASLHKQRLREDDGQILELLVSLYQMSKTDALVASVTQLSLDLAKISTNYCFA